MFRTQQISTLTATGLMVGNGLLMGWLLAGPQGPDERLKAFGSTIVETTRPSLTPNPVTVSPVPPPPASTSSPRGTGLGAPDHLTGTRDLTSVSLRWHPVTGAVGYVIYRDGVEVGQTTGLSFDDTRLRPGVMHTWTVAAIDGHGTVGDMSAPFSTAPGLLSARSP